MDFPDRWQVDNLNSAGFDKPGLTSEQIRERIENPIAGPSLEELARDKKQAVIVFDDMTRPTPFKNVAPIVLESLRRAGMKKEQIRFIWALGAHGTYDMINARKKLGDEIVENYAVFNHDAFQNTVKVGRTPTGVELWFNREFMSCDLKIGIGCITAHIHAGFGGGSKIVLPGVAGIESINQFHNQLCRDPSRTGLGNLDNNIMRDECDAAGDAVGLNFKVDCMINRRGEIANLYAGSFRETLAAGAAEGIDHYGIEHADDFDIAVCNAYGKVNEAAIAAFIGLQLIKKQVGTVVLITDAPEGQVPHYAFRSWGSDYGGRQFTPAPVGALKQALKKFIILAPYPDRTLVDALCHIDDAVIVKTWAEALQILETDYPKGARVGVLQDGTMQYIKPAVG